VCNSLMLVNSGHLLPEYCMKINEIF